MALRWFSRAHLPWTHFKSKSKSKYLSHTGNSWLLHANHRINIALFSSPIIRRNKSMEKRHALEGLRGIIWRVFEAIQWAFRWSISTAQGSPSARQRLYLSFPEVSCLPIYPAEYYMFVRMVRVYMFAVSTARSFPSWFKRTLLYSTATSAILRGLGLNVNYSKKAMKGARQISSGKCILWDSLHRNTI